jgi:hypothetical protein
MSVLAEVRKEFERRSLGTPVATKRLLGKGTRAAVDQALTRLTAEGFLVRACRGVYYRPVENRFVGRVPAEAEQVVRELASAHGETLTVHGAEAARQFRLSTQVPMNPVFLTSGRTRVIQVGNRKVSLRHVSPRELALAGTRAGAALQALKYVGPGAAATALPKVLAQLSAEEAESLRAATEAMPSWLSDEFYRLERSSAVASG